LTGTILRATLFRKRSKAKTQPDLLSRSAVAKMLIEQNADAAEEPSGDAETKANPQDETVRKGPPSAP